MKLAKTLIAAMALMWTVAAGARTATDFFTTAPDRVFPLLAQSVRLDMVDYFNFGSTKSSRNAFDGEARLTALSPAAISFIADDKVEVQLAMLASPSDTLLAVVTTLSLPAGDSSIAFYDTDWNPVKKAPVDMGDYQSWLTPQGRPDEADVRLRLPFMPVRAAFTPDGSALILTNEYKSYLPASDVEQMEHKVLPSRIYDINGTRLRLRP